MAVPEVVLYRRKAAKYAAKRKHARALQYYQKVCELAPKDYMAWVKVGDLCREVKKPDTALEAYRHAANGFSADGKLLPAIGVFKMIAELDPDSADAQYQLDQLYQQRDQRTQKTFSADVLSQLKRKGEESSQAESEEVELTSVEEEGWDDSDLDVEECLGDLDNALANAAGSVEATDPSEFDPFPPLFDSLSREQFYAVVETMDRQSVPEGEYILREGGRGHHFYILVDGTATVLKKDKNGDDQQLGKMGPGDFFGEIALFEGTPRTASVITQEECELLIVDHVKLMSLLIEHPELRQAIREFYRHRLLRTILRFHPAFESLSDQALWALVGEFEFRSYEAGELVVQSGDVVDALHVIERGAVMTFQPDHITCETLHRGEFLEQEPFLASVPAVSSSIASSATNLFSLSRASFDVLISEFPDVGSHL